MLEGLCFAFLVLMAIIGLGEVVKWLEQLYYKAGSSSEKCVITIVPLYGTEENIEDIVKKTIVSVKENPILGAKTKLVFTDEGLSDQSKKIVKMIIASNEAISLCNGADIGKITQSVAQNMLHIEYNKRII